MNPYREYPGLGADERFPDRLPEHWDEPDDEAESEFIARAVVFACVVLAGIVMLSARMGWF